MWDIQIPEMILGGQLGTSAANAQVQVEGSLAPEQLKC